ncbi:MAG: hypothetical protein BroJett003_24990 [Planctomycetota bacterium]|nr:MAG: hypothetical protein BroJett003_24990 [Planctomycetota bacterium]
MRPIRAVARRRVAPAITADDSFRRVARDRRVPAVAARACVDQPGRQVAVAAPAARSADNRNAGNPRAHDNVAAVTTATARAAGAPRRTEDRIRARDARRNEPNVAPVPADCSRRCSGPSGSGG